MEVEEDGRRVEAAALLLRVERFYLLLLRVALLFVATLILLWALWLGGSAGVKIFRSANSVVQQPASVAAAEVAEVVRAPVADATSPAKTPTATSEQRRDYQTLLNRYYALYRTRFDIYRRPEDKSLDRDGFDDNYLQTDQRLAGVADGSVSFATDHADLTALVDKMTAAASQPILVARLGAYKRAKLRPVTRKVQKYRTEQRRGWDSLSTSCPGWYYSPIGCAVTRSTQIPYTDTVTAMALPDGLISPSRAFRAMQDQYFSLLTDRRQKAAADATTKREEIMAGNADGWDRVSMMLRVLAAFVVLMFFFLLIAIERHQSRIALWLNRSGARE